MRRLNRDETVDTKGQVAINFITLALLRGTTPLMMYLAVTNLDSAPLVVAIKCGITFLLFSVSLLWFMSKDTQLQCHVINNLRNKHTYWKLCKFLSFVFLLGEAPTSICHFFHLSVCPSYTISQEPYII